MSSPDRVHSPATSALPPLGTIPRQNGAVSLAEVQAVVADFTEEQFAGIDTNADGLLDEAELAAAVEAGVIPAE